MPWEANNENVEKINNGHKLTTNVGVTPEIINPLVQLLVYLKEA